MIVSEVKLYNFRKFKSVENKPGLSISFHEGLNAIIGENDSGKTAVIDAIKLVLLTHSNEYLRVGEEDFYTDDEFTANELKIDITLSRFHQNEAKNFVEYLEFEKNGDEVDYFLHLHFTAWKAEKSNRIFSELRAGGTGKTDQGDSREGVLLDGGVRELLKVVYLKPLRDAEREMRAGRYSRISQILYNHPIFRSAGNDHKLVEILTDANEEIAEYFTKDKEGKQILSSIRSSLLAFNERGTSSEARIETSDYQLKSILETLSLAAAEIHPGLGELNLLFIAAELLLLEQDDLGGLRLALIEELEAHLHPQAQLRLIQYLQGSYNESGVQIIISTHSTVLASRINLKNIILLKNGRGYELTPDKTKLEKGDYLFLQRFLDVTKANMFFAKGIIMVEGDAENLLIPTIADIIGRPLEKYGVSIVNVGSTAFLRYSRIFVREGSDKMNIPVSVITDCDVKPIEVKPLDKEGNARTKAIEQQEIEDTSRRKHGLYDDMPVLTFVSPAWTLEYCIALSGLWKELHKAIKYAKKIKNSNMYTLTPEKIIKANKEVEEDQKRWENMSERERAKELYGLMLDESGKSDLKSIVAQCLVALMRWGYTKHDGIGQDQMFDMDLYQMEEDHARKWELERLIEKDDNLSYIVAAIKYATDNVRG